MDGVSFKDRFSNLFAPGNRGHVDQVQVMNSPPSESLIGNVYLVPTIGERLLYIIQDDGRVQIPGGKKESGETYLETIQREMKEETGAIVKNFKVIGAWHLILKSAKPLKPHLPHPEMYQVVGIGEVDLYSEPSNPEGSHKTIDVRLDTLERVTEVFTRAGRSDLAELYQLAWEFRESTFK